MAGRRVAHRLEKLHRRQRRGLQDILYRVAEPAAIIQFIQRGFGSVKPGKIGRRDPGRIDDLIRCSRSEAARVFLRLFPHGGAGQQLQKAQLQHMRPQRKSAMEAGGEGFQIFIWQPGNQIKVQVHVARFQHLLHAAHHGVQIGAAADGGKGDFGKALQPDFQLHGTGRHLTQQGDHFITQQVGSYFKVNTKTGRDALSLLLQYKPKQVFRPVAMGIEGAVYQL